MNSTMYEKYRMRMYEAVRRMNEYAEAKDIARNHVNYGVASAIQAMLQDFGHSVDLRVYGDGDYLVLDIIVIDGEEIKIR